MAELALSHGKSGVRQLGKLPVRVDLTALVDLAFLLITFFMLATTLTKQKILPLTMPDKGPANAPWAASQTLTICLGKANQAVYYLGLPDKPIIAPTAVANGGDMEKMLLETGKKVYAATGKNMIVILKPSDHSIYNSLVNTLDELNITQTTSYAIADITGQDIELLKSKKLY
jgi:biopolymer transport protein ExbD